MKVKGVAERGLGQDKRKRVEGRERKERSGSGTRQQPNLELQQHLIIYQWKVRHILSKNNFHSIQCTVSILTLQNLIQFLTDF